MVKITKAVHDFIVQNRNLLDTNNLNLFFNLAFGPSNMGIRNYLSLTNLIYQKYPGCLKHMKSIPPYFFAYSDMDEIEIPDNIKVIQYSAFYNSKIENIKLPDTLERIEWDSFNGCRQLKSIVIPDSVDTLGDRTFKNCASLKEITLPKDLKTMVKTCFYDCDNLETVIYDGSRRKFLQGSFEQAFD